MCLAYLGIGSNLGNRQKNIEKSKILLEAKKIRVLRTSPLYETEALCRLGQTMPDFLNGVFEVETFYVAEELLSKIEEVEKEMGRISKGDWASRVIDLDLLFYGSEIVNAPRLKIPHPEIENRWFVLKPLSDLIPEFKHPVIGKTIKEILCNFSSIQRM